MAVSVNRPQNVHSLFIFLFRLIHLNHFSIFLVIPSLKWHGGIGVKSTGIKPRCGTCACFLGFRLARKIMMTLSALLALCEGNPPVTDGFPSQGASCADLWYFVVIVVVSLINFLNKQGSCRRFIDDTHAMKPTNLDIKWCNNVTWCDKMRLWLKDNRCLTLTGESWYVSRNMHTSGFVVVW